MVPGEWRKEVGTCGTEAGDIGCNSDNVGPKQEYGGRKSRMCMHIRWYQESVGRKWENLDRSRRTEDVTVIM